jgi:FlaA1/EpsC-like NDP-sugar epimerase/lipopolysaccharide/colanic/teichoic acid biosynthesis glycosyltransferase
MKEITLKRIFDILTGLGGVLLLFPLAAAAMLIRFKNSGPVFTREEKMGKGFRKFTIYGFRPVNGKSLGPFSPPLEVKTRKKRVLRFIEKATICNAPQFWNILRGDMSLFGPKPEGEELIRKFEGDYREILKIRPGMIDLVSLVSGNGHARGKGPEPSDEGYLHVSLPERVKLARLYAERSSFFYDLKFILRSLFRRLYPSRRIQDFARDLAAFRRPVVVGLQTGIFALSNYLAFYIRFEGDVPEAYLYPFFLYYLPLLLSIRVLFLFAFSLDRGVWRYASIRDVISIVSATTFGSFLFFGAVSYFMEEIYPRSVMVTDWFLNIFMLGGIRMFWRLHQNELKAQLGRKRTLIIGAGDAADLLIRDISRSAFYPHEIIGLIDDNPKTKGLRIRDIPVLGDRRELGSIVEKVKPEEFIIAIPSASREHFKEIVKDLRQYGLPILALPSFWSILNGNAHLSSLNVIDAEDILFRPPVSEALPGVKELLGGKTVMVTGAGGSIGSELCRQILSFGPACVVLLERHEESLFKIERELGAKKDGPLSVVPVIGDILDVKRVEGVFEEFRPQIVFHAAAYKHVPLMESNPYEAFRTNAGGTRIMAHAAKKYGAHRFVLISTDKAVNPISVMGMTKKIAEEIVKSLGSGLSPSKSNTKFVTVRFGNVLGSSGSVVPLFTEQIEKGGPVTVTHPEMVRYFMTIPEAVNLVLQAATLGESGDIFVLDMGKPIKIMDLAKRMIGLHGYRPGTDMEIRFVGLRPGEKLEEELFNSYEIVEKTPHPKLLKAISNGRNGESAKSLENLAELTTEEVARILPQLISHSRPPFLSPANDPSFLNPLVSNRTHSLSP